MYISTYFPRQKFMYLLFKDLLTLGFSLDSFSNLVCGSRAPFVSSCVEGALMALTLGGY